MISSSSKLVGLYLNTRMVRGKVRVSAAISGTKSLFPLSTAVFDDLGVLGTAEEQSFRQDMIKISNFLISLDRRDFVALLKEAVNYTGNSSFTYDYEQELAKFLDSSFGITYRPAPFVDVQTRISEALAWIEQQFPDKDLKEVSFEDLFNKIKEMEPQLAGFKYPKKFSNEKKIFKGVVSYLQNNGFDCHNLLVGFTGNKDFSDNLRLGKMWKDPYLYPIHGEYSHMFQMAVLCKAQEKGDLNLENPLVEIVKKSASKIDVLELFAKNYSIKHMNQDHFKREVRNLWVLLFDNAINGIVVKDHYKFIQSTCSSPFYVNEKCCELISDVADRQKKRMAEWRIPLPVEIFVALHLLKFKSALRTIYNVDFSYYQRKFNDLKNPQTVERSEQSIKQILRLTRDSDMRISSTFIGLKKNQIEKERNIKKGESHFVRRVSLLPID